MKTATFIDGAYLDKVLENRFNHARINLGKFATEIGGEQILRTYYYHCAPYVSPEQTSEEIKRLESKKRFFRALTNIPRFQIRLGRLVYRGKNEHGQPIFVQKLVDVMLSVDMVRLSATGQINRVILVAGDEDFLPAIEVVKDLGVLVTLLHGPVNPTNDHKLWERVDDRVEIDQGLVERVLR